MVELEKKEDILDWEWGLISDPGEREKRQGTKIPLVRSYCRVDFRKDK